MEFLDLLLLLGAGLATGFIASLIGIGGGVIFAPVLFFYFQSEGVPGTVIAPLTIGTSLLCTFVVAGASAFFQHRKRAVVWGVAGRVGLLSAVAVFLMTRYVTTQPWYDGTVFQAVFGALLLVVAVRMLTKKVATRPATDEAASGRRSWPTLAGTGTAAGVVSAAAGVGGGVVLVPLYHGVLRLPMPKAVATSSATIIFIAALGVLNYAALGLSAADLPGGTLGYVDVLRALLLAVPSVLTARLGVQVAHRIATRRLRLAFGVFAVLAALRLLWRALG